MWKPRSEADAGPCDRGEKWNTRRGPDPTIEPGLLRESGGARRYVSAVRRLEDAAPLQQLGGRRATPAVAFLTLDEGRPSYVADLGECADSHDAPLKVPCLEAETGEQWLDRCSRIARRECACPRLDARSESLARSLA